MMEIRSEKWPTDFYYVGEQVLYDCPICYSWADAKVIAVDHDKLVLSHNGTNIALYEEDYLRVEEREYYGN